jgi:hypothetical protein
VRPQLEATMSLAEFLPRLLEHGEVRLRRRPTPSPADREQARRVLQDAFVHYRLDVAGPVIAFDAASALAAAEAVQMACWFLVNRDEPEEAVKQALQLTAAPDSPSAHLSADVVLRFLAHVHRRARTLEAADVLTRELSDILRKWPLTGVQSDVDEPPLTPLEFGGHEGLLLLYAERFVRRPKPAWRPPGGRLLEYVELVEMQLEKPNAGP